MIQHRVTATGYRRRNTVLPNIICGFERREQSFSKCVENKDTLKFLQNDMAVTHTLCSLVIEIRWKIKLGKLIIYINCLKTQKCIKNLKIVPILSALHNCVETSRMDLFFIDSHNISNQV